MFLIALFCSYDEISWPIADPRGADEMRDVYFRALLTY